MTRLRGHLSRTRSNARRGAILALLLVLGCGGRHNVNGSSQPEETPERTFRQVDIWVLEAGGTPPDDTTYTLIAGQRRVVVLRNGAPDLATFAVLTFPDSSLKAPEGTPVELTVRVRPGVYGVDIDCKAETAGRAHRVQVCPSLRGAECGGGEVRLRHRVRARPRHRAPQ